MSGSSPLHLAIFELEAVCDIIIPERELACEGVDNWLRWSNLALKRGRNWHEDTLRSPGVPADKQVGY